VKRLLLDQGLPRSTRTFLAPAEWDVVHVGEVGLSRATDQSILDYGRENDRICVTLDADFHALLAIADAAKPSVVRIRKEGLHAKAIAGLLMKIWPRIERSASDGAMITITEKSIRVRGLPISRKRQ
jgi:predicted nuclease of predicted toxin-antitoxin system